MGLRWKTDFYTLEQTSRYYIEIDQAGFAGTAKDIQYIDGFLSRRRGEENEINKIIRGTEYQFSFWVTPSDGSEYDPIFTAGEREFTVTIKKGSTVIFTGYIEQAASSKVLIGNRYRITLSIIDALGTLKDIPYTDNGNFLDGRESILTILKRALDQTGLSLNFKVQLGTYEKDLMTSTQCALKECDIDNGRFLEYKDGRLVPMNCYEVVEQCLRPFNCTIEQEENYWLITNNDEFNSYVFEYDSSLTELSRTAKNRIVAVDSNKFKSKGDVSFKLPVKRYEVKFENKYVKANTITNGNFSSGLTDWNNGASPNNFETSFSVVSNVLVAKTGDSSTQVDKNFYHDPVSVTQNGSNDYFEIKLQARIKSITWKDPSNTKLPKINFDVTGPNGTLTRDGGEMSMNWKEHSDTTIPVDGTGNYTLKIWVIAQDDWSNLEVEFDDIYMSPVYDNDVVTTDKFVGVQNTGLSVERKEAGRVKIGDSAYANDEGSIQISGSVTALWNSYGNTENKPLLELLGEKQLKHKSAFYRMIRVRIYDEADTLKPSNVFTFDSLYYRPVRWNKDYFKKEIDCTLVEMKQDAITVSGYVESADTVNGGTAGSGSGGSSTVSWMAVASKPTWLDYSTKGDFETGHSHEFANLYNKPTTLAGYGITDAEPAFSKNTAFNKDFGTTAGTVAEGNHTHSQYADATAGETILGDWIFTGSNKQTGGALWFNDNIKLRMGNAPDWDIYFNGTYLVIEDRATTTGSKIRFTRGSAYYYLDLSNGQFTGSADKVNAGTGSGSTYLNILTANAGINQPVGSSFVQVRHDLGYLKAQRVYLAGTTYGIREATGSYGSVRSVGLKSGWGGFAAEAAIVLMANGSGTSNRFGLYNDVDNYWLLQAGASASTTLPNAVGLYYSGSLKLETTSGGIKVTGTGEATDWKITSDKRLKEDVCYLSKTIFLKKVLKVGELGARFKWINSGERDIGFIAQDIEPILPEVVGSGEIKTISYAKMVVPLYTAFAAIVEKYDKEILDLKAKIYKLETGNKNTRKRK